MPDTNVIMPQMGESIFEGTITSWLKSKGDTIERDEPLFEISTDKVESQIPAPAAAVLKDILVEEGQTVEINTVVAVIAEPGVTAEIAPEKDVKAATKSKVSPVVELVSSIELSGKEIGEIKDDPNNIKKREND